ELLRLRGREGGGILGLCFASAATNVLVALSADPSHSISVYDLEASATSKLKKGDDGTDQAANDGTDRAVGDGGENWGEEWIVTGGQGHLRLWSVAVVKRETQTERGRVMETVATLTCRKVPLGTRATKTILSLASMGTTLLCGTHDGSILLVRGGGVVGEAKVGGGVMSMSVDGNSLVTGGQDGIVKVWGLEEEAGGGASLKMESERRVALFANVARNAVDMCTGIRSLKSAATLLPPLSITSVSAISAYG
ncbi:hypothetical protein T484DRAFT_1813366, partial [Baffinella frigidus]